MISNRRSWKRDGFRQVALILVCLGLVLCASVNAQDTVAKQSDQPADVAQDDTSACGCAGDPCGACGVGGYGVGGYDTGGYGAGGGAGAAQAAGVGSFNAFGAAGGAGAAASGAGAAPYMIGDLLMGNRVLTFSYERAGSTALAADLPAPFHGMHFFVPALVQAGGIVNIRNTKVAENNNAIPTDRFAYEYNYFKNGMSVTGISEETVETGLPVPYPQTRFTTHTERYDVNIHTFTYEKTFLCGAGSVEVRMPFAHGLSSDLNFSAGTAYGLRYYDGDAWNLGMIGPDDDSLYPGYDNPNLPGDFDQYTNYWALMVDPTQESTWGATGWELHDISLVFKFLLHYDPCRERYISAGMQLVAPTARDVQIGVSDYWGYGREIYNWGIPGLDPTYPLYSDTIGQRLRNFKIENNTWALSPFLAMTSKPTSRTFFNGFLQLDIPVGTNTVHYTQDYYRLKTESNEIQFVDPTDPLQGWTGQSMGPDGEDVSLQNVNDEFLARDPDFQSTATGEVADQTLMHLDVAVGYYLYMNPCARVVKAVIPSVEFHLTQTVSHPDRLVLPESGFYQESTPSQRDEPAPVVGNPADNNTITDVTIGVHSYLGKASMLSVGGVFPLGKGWDRTFDSEIAVKFNHAF